MTRPEASGPLIQAHNLAKRFPLASGKWQQAVDQVDLDLAAGEILGLVGESGSGKSTLGRLLLRLSEADSGSITCRGQDVRSLTGSALLEYRRFAQIVFQNPRASLDPHQSIQAAFREILRFHRVPRAEIGPRITAALERVGLSGEIGPRHPKSFSGGQLQRIAIARALLCEPALLVADEAVSALDVSVQAQVLKLLAELRQSMGLAILFISHDLRAVAWLCDRVAVMHQGRIVETGFTGDVFGRPKHSHTRLLIGTMGTLVEVQPPDPIIPHQAAAESSKESNHD